MQIASLLSNYEIPTRKKRCSERASLIKEIYEIYTSDGEQARRKRENWKRYCQYCREWRKSNCLSSQKEFKRSRSFIQEIKIKSFCYLTSHIPTKDLYYVLSVLKDKVNRGENGFAWLFGNIKSIPA